MGFVSINGFEIKISGGNGEVCVSRDLYRVATRTDFFRMMSVYYSGPGFFINNAILMTTVYLQTWILAVLALAGAYLISSGALQESEGVGLTKEDDTVTEATRKAANAPDEEGGRRLLDYDRSLLQNYGALYSGGTTEPDVPADEPPPKEPNAEEVLSSQDQLTINYYNNFNNVDPNAKTDQTYTVGGNEDSLSAYYSEFVDSTTSGPAQSSSAASGGSSSRVTHSLLFGLGLKWSAT